VAHGWKAPRVQPISDPLRGGPGEAALGPRFARCESGAYRGHASPALSRSRVRAGPARRDRRRRTAPARLGRRPHCIRSPPGAPRSRDMRCPSGSGWGEALVADPASRKSAADPASRVSYARVPDGRRWTAKALQPLARETSAGGARRVGWSLIEVSVLQPPAFRVARLGQASTSRATTRIRWSAQRMASTPSGGLLPTQRKLGAPRRRARSGDRSILWLCSWIELVAEVDERHLVQVSHRGGQPPRRALGLAYRPRARCGERVLEAGPRRQSRGHGGGLSMILWAARAALAGERALVEGRRPGTGEAARL